MPHGGPDWGEAGLPDYAAGQLPWFQSESNDVGIGADENLINYVVPDGYELHACSGIISCEAPRTQKFRFVTTPAGTWISPIGHIDSFNEWDNEERAYDGNVVTCAFRAGVINAWTGDLILLVNAATIDKIRFYALDIGEIDVDVYDEDGWHDVYQGVYANEEWVEKDVPAGLKAISRARVKFYNTDYLITGEVKTAALYEFMFNATGASPQEWIYFDTYAIIPYLPEAPYPVPSGATFTLRVHNDDAAKQKFSVNLAGFLQAKA